jgi:hypothetical protein
MASLGGCAASNCVAARLSVPEKSHDMEKWLNCTWRHVGGGSIVESKESQINTDAGGELRA